MGMLLLNGSSDLNPRELFASGEQGLWLDPSDFSTMWQDAAGDTPVTAASDPVALILDKSRSGPSMGSNQVTNGGFGADSDWTKGTGWTIGSGVATKTAGSASLLSQAQTMTVGRYYIVTYTITRTAGSITPQFAGGTTVSGTARSTSGTFTDIMTVVSGNNTLQLSADASFAGTVDNVSLKELSAGNHAYQTTSASRPTLARIPSSGRRNLLTYSEQFDRSPWTGGANRTVTANTVVSPDGLQTGDRVVISASGAIYVSLFVTATVTENTQYTFSYYLNTTTSLAGNTFRIYNVTGGADIVAVQNCVYGGGWIRQTCTFTTPAGCTSIYAYPVSISVNNQQNSFFEIWGAQLETGSTATNYQKVVATTDVTESGVSDLWHIVFDGSDDSLVTNSIPFDTWTQDTRRNLLVDTESFGASTWVKINVTAADNTTDTTDPLGTNTSSKLTASSSTVRCAQSFTGRTAGENWVFSFYVKAGTATQVQYIVSNGLAETSNSIGEFTFSNQTFSGSLGSYVTSRTATDVGNGWYRIVLICTIPAGQTAIRFNLALPIVNTATAYYWGAQAELATSATTYQQVGTDEMTVIGGVRKLSDAAVGMVAELTASLGGNNGSFAIFTPNTAAATTYSFGSKGTNAVIADTSSGFAAPLTNVLTLQADISGDSVIGRINAAQVASSTSDQGTGNYSNAILYIGRRGGSSFPFTGHIYQLIVRGKTTPTGKLLEAERFVARRTGVSF